MNDYLQKTIPNLKAFNHELHFESLLINKSWVLVNGIANKKSTYTFKDDHTLEISRKDQAIKTSWSVDTKNVFSIETEDGIIIVNVYFKDDDILVLNHKNKEEFAILINTKDDNDSLNSIADVQKFLKEKYIKKVTRLIYSHKFYYIENSKEFGPFTVEELSEKVKKDHISTYCFVRDINEYDYSNRIRIIDLIKEL